MICESSTQPTMCILLLRLWVRVTTKILPSAIGIYNLLQSHSSLTQKNVESESYTFLPTSFFACMMCLKFSDGWTYMTPFESWSLFCFLAMVLSFMFLLLHSTSIGPRENMAATNRFFAKV